MCFKYSEWPPSSSVLFIFPYKGRNVAYAMKNDRGGCLSCLNGRYDTTTTPFLA